MPRRSRLSARRSTTSPRTSKSPRSLRELIDELPQSLADEAFLHSSFTGSRAESYERLEFLGDSVLGLSVVAALFERYPELHEGHLSRARGYVVSRKACADVARSLDLGDRLRTAEDQAGLRTNERVLAATLEAVIGALFLHFGADAIREAVADAFWPAVEEAMAAGADPKTRLQERAALDHSIARYTTVRAEGPDHDRSFTAAVLIDDVVVATGTGRSKKEAEQEAAKTALRELDAAAPS